MHRAEHTQYQVCRSVDVGALVPLTAAHSQLWTGLLHAVAGGCVSDGKGAQLHVCYYVRVGVANLKSQINTQILTL